LSPGRLTSRTLGFTVTVDISSLVRRGLHLPDTFKKGRGLSEGSMPDVVDDMDDGGIDGTSVHGS